MKILFNQNREIYNESKVWKYNEYEYTYGYEEVGSIIFDMHMIMHILLTNNIYNKHKECDKEKKRSKKKVR